MTSILYFKLTKIFNTTYSDKVHKLIILVFLILISSTANARSKLFSPLPSLSASQLGVIVNDSDPLSIKIAKYYQHKRNIPEHNIIHIHFNPKHKKLSVKAFKKLKKIVDSNTPQNIQAYALTWMNTYRVGCMSITTAFAAGYDESFCAKGCKKTKLSPYFNSEKNLPYTTYKWRPTMALAGHNFSDVKSLIDKGVSSDYSHPQGSAYLLQTSDKARSTRSSLFPQITNQFNKLWPIIIVKKDYIKNKKDVMFYFTGKKHIEKIDSNHFLPGAVADHLTSTGGVLPGSKQMSIIEWIKAGATGSYGAVIEPCNYIQKFPRPGIMMHYYLRGNSLIEAYWKSVAWPGQGIFIGEPLAKPFAYTSH